jgi:hypothetical protein
MSLNQSDLPLDPPTPSGIGTDKQNDGTSLVPAATPVPVAADLSQSGDTRQRIEQVQAVVKETHAAAFEELQAIANHEQDTGWASYDDLLNGCTQLLTEAGDFEQKLLQAQMNLTLFTPKKK